MVRVTLTAWCSCVGDTARRPLRGVLLSSTDAMLYPCGGRELLAACVVRRVYDECGEGMCDWDASRYDADAWLPGMT